MMRNVLAGRAATQLGDNKNLFDHTYAGNAADAHLLAAEKLLRSPVGVAGEAFLITDGLPLPMFDFVREVARAAGRPVAPGAVRVIPTWAALAIAFVLGVGVLDRREDAAARRYRGSLRHHESVLQYRQGEGAAWLRAGCRVEGGRAEGRRGEAFFFILCGSGLLVTMLTFAQWYLANQKKE